MRMLCLFAAVMSNMVSAHASPSKQVVATCLQARTISAKVPYVDLAPGEFTVEEDEERKTVSKTFVHRHRNLGVWERMASHQFGLIFDNREIQARQVIRLGAHAPSVFNPYTTQWGEIHAANEAYLCITYNFEGLGQSGSFQNIRALYLVDLKRRPTKFFYAVGDIRTSPK